MKKIPQNRSYYESLPRGYLPSFVPVGAASVDPADGSTYCFGVLHGSGAQLITNYDRVDVELLTRCKITKAVIAMQALTVIGTNEQINMYIRVNNTTDTLIASVSAATEQRKFTNSDLNILLEPTDNFVIKVAFPTWATNPTGVRFAGILCVEEV